MFDERQEQEHGGGWSNKWKIQLSPTRWNQKIEFGTISGIWSVWEYTMFGTCIKNRTIQKLCARTSLCLLFSTLSTAVIAHWLENSYGVTGFWIRALAMVSIVFLEKALYYNSAPLHPEGAQLNGYRRPFRTTWQKGEE